MKLLSIKEMKKLSLAYTEMKIKEFLEGYGKYCIDLYNQK